MKLVVKMLDFIFWGLVALYGLFALFFARRYWVRRNMSDDELFDEYYRELN
jgi:hypothetical protein